MSAESYAAIKLPFVYENLVAKIRITMASLLVRTAAIVLSDESIPPTARLLVKGQENTPPDYAELDYFHGLL